MKLFKTPREGDQRVLVKFAYFPKRVIDKKTEESLYIWLQKYTETGYFISSYCRRGFWSTNYYINYRSFKEILADYKQDKGK